MKRNIFQKEQLLLLVAMSCVCSQAHKLPYDLRPNRLPQETQTQLRSEDQETSPDAPRKALQFPETNGDGNGDDNEDYSVPISFRNGDDPSGSADKAGANDNLRRFYKYSHEHQNPSKEAIVFPNDNMDNVKGHKVHVPLEESIEGIPVISRSEGDNAEQMGMFTDESHRNTINATHFQQSLQALAQMVRQLLFRAPPPEINQRSEDAFQSGNSEPSTSSEMDVREQSLYSGPRVRVHGVPSECPQGTKKTRNGSCQKPSRRLVT